MRYYIINTPITETIPIPIPACRLLTDSRVVLQREGDTELDTAFKEMPVADKPLPPVHENHGISDNSSGLVLLGYY